MKDAVFGDAIQIAQQQIVILRTVVAGAQITDFPKTGI